MGQDILNQRSDDSISAREARARSESESSALFIPTGIELDPLRLLDAIAVAFEVVGDPLARVIVRRADGAKFTLNLEKARALLAEDSRFSNLHAIPKSDLRRSAADWFSAGMVFAERKFHRAVFLGLPKTGAPVKFAAHVALWRELIPFLDASYGFGFYRPYGLGPALFPMGILLNSGRYGSTQYDSNRVVTWAKETTGDPRLHLDGYRHERGMLLDVFPLNLFSPAHLRQKVGNRSLREWIAEYAGSSSVVDLGKDYAAWIVPPELILPARQILHGANLILPLAGSVPVVH